LFIGPAFGLSPHRNAVAVVAIGLQAPFELAWNTRDYRRWRREASARISTQASMDAGFSSPAHFSSAYRQMFGMEPSRLMTSLPAATS
jgi:AraC-like DNA-binding protein